MPKPKRNPPKSPNTKKKPAPEVAKPEKSAAPTPAPERSRAAEDALALRVAVLEDVMKRAHLQLARRLDDVEKRFAAPS